ncbi:amino acid adenylation domain-containing protein [Streptomyces sp. NPDC020845]|uniref:amino acid adenylation domain-containing protein n=1 Tax=Streptomyces sp. NPDC020845 TaxID=3365096 RepID=UPI0037B0BD78
MPEPELPRLSTGTEYDCLLAGLRGLSPWATTRPLAAPDRQPDAIPATRETWCSAGAMIAERCSADPSRTALSDGVAEVGYGELDARVNALAATLVRRGITRGEIVALVFDRGMAFVVALLAVWRAGAAYLPLSPSHPEAWLTGVARQAGVALVVGAPIPGFPYLDEVPEAAEPVEDRNAPEDLAYVIATSGSTGTPKLVMIEHGGLVNLVHAQREYLGGVPARSRVLQFPHPAFDAALFDVLMALPNGARLEVLGGPHLSGDPLAGVLTGRHITHAVLPAAVVRTLRPGRFPELDVLMSIGDVCLPETARQWGAHHRFVNGYGPTETTICATLHASVGAEQTRVPIGRPIAGCHVVILDEERNPVPPGAVGEICIGGLGVGRGYLGQPELTAERFIPDPAGGRLYRSGDLGRTLADGSIEFLGRVDDQVKVRGARVELGQVEGALAALPGVRDALAVLDRRGEPRLLGYVIADTDADTDAEELRASLASTLPAYVVPDEVVLVDRWPLTISGKVDRAALPRPGRATRETDAPRDETEAEVVRIAAELLGAERVGVHDDLFDLGGDSLFATQLVARLRSRLGVEVALRTVLECGTAAGIAAGIGVKATDRGPRPGAEPKPSCGQRRVWLMHGLSPDARAYHAQSVFRLAGELSLESLEASLTELVRVHDVLRSRFIEVDGELDCVVDEPRPVALEVRDLSGSQDQAAAVGAVVRELLGAPFDLAHEPPYRWTLLRLGAEEHVFVCVEHHLVHDGWSFHVFVRDLLDGYSEHLAHGRISRPAPPVGYYDYVRWQRQWLESEEADRQRAFWRAELDGAETVLRLPHRAGARATGFRGRAPRLEIDGELARRLADLAERSDVTLFTTLLTAFFVLLHHTTGSRDLLVGSGVANRRWQQTEDVLGMFVNTVVFRGRFDSDPTFAEFLRQIHERSLAVYEHQELPYDLIFAESPAGHGDGARPLVQAMFNFHDSPLGPLRPTPLDVTVVEGVGNGSAKFDMSVIAVPRYAEAGRISRLAGDLIAIPRSAGPVLPSSRSALQGITLAWEFDTDLFDESFCAHLLTAFETLLRTLVDGPDGPDGPDTPVSRLSPVSERTRAQLLEWGRGRHAEPPSWWMPDLVARWVRDTPDAIAVAGPDPLTYAELGARSDEVARYLRGSGLGGGDVVAVRVAHSPEAVVAQLAVMKSGAAYLPFDPEHPPARMGSLMADCGASVVVTTAALAADLPAGAIAVVLEDVPETGGDLPAGAGTDACYVMYTSGSTGRPKGILVEHRSVAARLHDGGVTDLAPGDTLLAVATMAFDVCVLEIWGPLVSGATVRFLPPPWHVADLARELTEPTVSHAALSTAVFHELVAEAPEAVRGLRSLLVAGDVISPESLQDLSARGITSVVNAYGPTETTVIVTGMPMDEWRPADQPRVPIGRPLPNTSVYVLDEHLRLVPPGVMGEICVGGPVVARGYVRPAPGFVPNPFGEGMLYRTGDRGRWLDGGLLDFAGRADDQVKIRGVRVEPAEVRAALLALPVVRDAVVVADRAADRLVAHVVSAESGAAVRRALAAEVPGHLVPSVVVPHERLPVNAVGKVDVRALGLPPRPVEPAAPRTALETLIVDLATDVLGVRPGVHDNVFELGMHSLQAMRLASRVAAATGRAVGLGLVLTQPTVARLASALESAPTQAEKITRIPR